VGAVDQMVLVQAVADAEYFLRSAGRSFTLAQVRAVQELFAKAYRWQYIVSGVKAPRFTEVLKSLVTAEQMERIGAALAPIVAAADC